MCAELSEYLPVTKRFLRTLDVVFAFHVPQNACYNGIICTSSLFGTSYVRSQVVCMWGHKTLSYDPVWNQFSAVHCRTPRPVWNIAVLTVLPSLLLLLWQCYSPSCSCSDSVTVHPAPALTVLLSLLLLLWQCYCPFCSCSESVTVPPAPALTVLLPLLLLLWLCYCPSCCDSVSVPPAPTLTVLLSLLLLLWQCYSHSCSDSVTVHPAVTVLVSLLFLLWQCYCHSCCDSVTLTPAVTLLLSLLLPLSSPFDPAVSKIVQARPGDFQARSNGCYLSASEVLVIGSW